MKDGKDLAQILQDIVSEIKQAKEWGAVADYIPELARVNYKQFGISVCMNDGQVYCAGDAEIKFSIQSVSKVFTLAIALGRLGHQLWNRVGREPSGRAFNSIVQLELEGGVPRNPFINAGAIVTTDAIMVGATPKETLAEILQFVRSATGSDSIFINGAVAHSEKETGHSNFALAHYMRAHNNLVHSPDLTLGTYFHQCAIEMNCKELALAGRFLCGLPEFNPLISQSRVKAINALMMTCGHYDGSGDFAYRIGIPGKSGVGGGILAIVPKIASVAVWSPGLNSFGNSLLGTLALEKLVQRTGWSVFG
ncbi:glutaminase [Flexibacterium corallicola]|uniref:glutaminase n=1 Tax=Flexibacterium corallicola TaxID=3037259 RepID=UPI00286ED3EF|nr:glutaminase [Pseudovibrio sp. M1P-2-3]